MDPNATLAALRALADGVLNHTEDGENLTSVAVDLAEHFDALDEWLSRGGFLPAAWSRSITKETA